MHWDWSLQKSTWLPSREVAVVYVALAVAALKQIAPRPSTLLCKDLFSPHHLFAMSHMTVERNTVFCY